MYVAIKQCSTLINVIKFKKKPKIILHFECTTKFREVHCLLPKEREYILGAVLCGSLNVVSNWQNLAILNPKYESVVKLGDIGLDRTVPPDLWREQEEVAFPDATRTSFDPSSPTSWIRKNWDGCACLMHADIT